MMHSTSSLLTQRDLYWVRAIFILTTPYIINLCVKRQKLYLYYYTYDTTGFLLHTGIPYSQYYHRL
jgi:hypothetical protein